MPSSVRSSSWMWGVVVMLLFFRGRAAAPGRRGQLRPSPVGPSRRHHRLVVGPRPPTRATSDVRRLTHSLRNSVTSPASVVSPGVKTRPAARRHVGEGAEAPGEFRGPLAEPGPSVRRHRVWDTRRMRVDVQTEIEIARPRADVAAFAGDPGNATGWYKNIEAVEWETPPPVAVGSRLRFRARFLGRSLEYTYEVRELDPGSRF